MPKIDNLVEELAVAMKAAANPSNQSSMEGYMKNRFEFFGTKAPQRNEVYKSWKPSISKLTSEEKIELIDALWKKPQREFQYVAVDLLTSRGKKEYSIDDIHVLEYFITEKSWWDSVDLIASNAVGTYFKLYPEQIAVIIPKWMMSQNMWLQRTCLIFQLKYKDKTDFELMKRLIVELLPNKEFFIQKAIGWCLRQHSKHNPTEVRTFIDEIPIEGLALREASKYL